MLYNLCLGIILVFQLIPSFISGTNILFLPHLWASSHISKHLHYGSILAENGYNVTILCQPSSQGNNEFSQYQNNVTILQMNISIASVSDKASMLKFSTTFHNYPFVKHFFMHAFGFFTREACIAFYDRIRSTRILVTTHWDLIIVDDPFTSCWSIVAATTSAPMAIMSPSFGYGIHQLRMLRFNPAFLQYGIWLKDSQPRDISWRLRSTLTAAMTRAGLTILQLVQTRSLAQYPLSSAWSLQEHQFVQERVMAFLQSYPMTLDQPKPLSPFTIYICCDWPTESALHGSECKKDTVLVTFGHAGVPVDNAGAMLSAMNQMPELKFIVQGMASNGVNIANNLTNGSRPQPHITIQAWVPQKTILRSGHTKLFITHGGINSIQESIAAGVPMMVVPQDWDQFVNAVNVERKGIGISAMSMNPLASGDWMTYIRRALDTAVKNQTGRNFEAIRSGVKFSTKQFIWQIHRISSGGKQFARKIRNSRDSRNVFSCLVVILVIAGMIHGISLRTQKKGPCK